jgi:serine/threonine protein kinase
LNLVYEYAPGGSLEAFLHKHRHTEVNSPATISEDVAIRIMLGLANGLVQIHGQNIAHGDIQNQNTNVLLMGDPMTWDLKSPDPLVKYSDFGNAFVADETDKEQMDYLGQIKRQDVASVLGIMSGIKLISGITFESKLIKSAADLLDNIKKMEKSLKQ